MIRSLLTTDLIAGPHLAIASGIALVGVVGVLAIPPRRPLAPLATGIAVAVLTAAVSFALSYSGALGGLISRRAIAAAAIGLGAAAIGIHGTTRNPRSRRLWGGGCAVAALIAGALGVNSAYGVTPTLASLAGFQSLDRVDLPQRVAVSPEPLSVALSSWTPPDDMPQHGRVGALSDDLRIPSGAFVARDAGIYLPPAALVPAPPPLPLLVFMMGQPGTPAPTLISSQLDDYARDHEGLAPIVVVVDQLGSPMSDPACADSERYGPVETYINEELPRWVEGHLNVTKDRSGWAIGGYSNGGACAMTYGARHPETWGTVIDVSGTRAPGSDRRDHTIDDVFDGDAAAYEANAPEEILASASPGAYDGHSAMFTWGADDTAFGPDQRIVAAAAEAAGFAVATHEVDGADHSGPALTGGVAWALTVFGRNVGLDQG